jgi:hypothetical protein
VCERYELTRVERERVKQKRVTLLTVLASGGLLATAFGIYAIPDGKPEGSAQVGTLLLGLAALTYTVPKLQEKDRVEAVEPLERRTPRPPAACVLRPAINEPIEVRGRDATLQGVTGTWGQSCSTAPSSGRSRSWCAAVPCMRSSGDECDPDLVCGRRGCEPRELRFRPAVATASSASAGRAAAERQNMPEKSAQHEARGEPRPRVRWTDRHVLRRAVSSRAIRGWLFTPRTRKS